MIDGAILERLENMAVAGLSFAAVGPFESFLIESVLEIWSVANIYRVLQD